MEGWEERLRLHVEEGRDSEWQDVEKALTEITQLRAGHSFKLAQTQEQLESSQRLNRDNEGWIRSIREMVGRDED